MECPSWHRHFAAFRYSAKNFLAYISLPESKHVGCLGNRKNRGGIPGLGRERDAGPVYLVQTLRASTYSAKGVGWDSD